MRLGLYEGSLEADVCVWHLMQIITAELHLLVGKKPVAVI